MHILEVIKKTYKLKEERNWDYIYIAIDIHGTICHPTYNDKINFLPFAKEVLQMWTKMDDIKLILFTCTKNLDPYLELFKENDIHFDSINESLEKDSNLASFNQKPYFNILLDDKAGFHNVYFYDIYNWYQMKNSEEAKYLNDNNFVISDREYEAILKFLQEYRILDILKKRVEYIKENYSSDLGISIYENFEESKSLTIEVYTGATVEENIDLLEEYWDTVCKDYNTWVDDKIHVNFTS